MTPLKLAKEVLKANVGLKGPGKELSSAAMILAEAVVKLTEQTKVDCGKIVEFTAHFAELKVKYLQQVRAVKEAEEIIKVLHKEVHTQQSMAWLAEWGTKK